MSTVCKLRATLFVSQADSLPNRTVAAISKLDSIRKTGFRSRVYFRQLRSRMLIVGPMAGSLRLITIMSRGWRFSANRIEVNTMLSTCARAAVFAILLPVSAVSAQNVENPSTVSEYEPAPPMTNGNREAIYGELQKANASIEELKQDLIAFRNEILDVLPSTIAKEITGSQDFRDQLTEIRTAILDALKREQDLRESNEELLNTLSEQTTTIASQAKEIEELRQQIDNPRGQPPRPDSTQDTVTGRVSITNGYSYDLYLSINGDLKQIGPSRDPHVFPVKVARRNGKVTIELFRYRQTPNGVVSVEPIPNEKREYRLTAPTYEIRLPIMP